MYQDIDYEKAMEIINSHLREMKREMDEIDEMPLKGPKKRLAKYMKRIYKKLEEMVNIYTSTQEHGDFNNICRELEALKPSFILNYNEICYEKGLQRLNEALDEMESELKEMDAMHLSGTQEERVKEMHGIYETLYEKVDHYAHSHDHQDLETALKEMELLMPEFVLTYHELTDIH